MQCIDPGLCGAYRGVRKVRVGREDELTPKERKALAKPESALELRLRTDGTFVRQVTEGQWRKCGGAIEFQPELFNGETLATMRAKSEGLGRTFGLAFLFDAFLLEIHGSVLVTPDDGTPLYVEYARD